MGKLKGRYACVTVNASTTEKVVAELNKQDLDRSSDVLSTPVFGNDGWSRASGGTKKYAGSFEGYYDPTDTTGQAAIIAAWESGEPLNDIRFYYKYSTTPGEVIYYDKPSAGAGNGVIITNVRKMIEVNGVGEISFSYEGSGPVESVTDTVPAA
jgi:hypothetical protein